MKKWKCFVSLLLLGLCFFVVPKSVEASESWGDYLYTVLEDGTIQIDKYTGIKESITIPATINGKKVTTLARNMLRYDQTQTITNSGSTGTIVISPGANETIKTITISKNVTTIDSMAFEYAPNLEKISVVAANGSFKSYNGILYNKDKTELIRVPYGKEMEKFTVPKTVKTICSFALDGPGVKSLILPSGLKKIEAQGIMADGIETLTVPASVTEIENNGIYYCDSLKTLTFEKGKLTTIDNMDVSYCEDLQVVEIPETITEMGRFYECVSLKEINVNTGNTRYSSKDGILFNKDKTQIIYYPCGRTDKAYTVPENVTSIGAFCFYAADNLEVVGLHKELEEMQRHVFAYCSSLTEIRFEGTKTKYTNIGGLTDGNDAFANIVKYKAHIHEFVETTTKSATTGRAGTITLSCECGYKFTRKIFKVDTLELSAAAYTYNGNKRTPYVIIKDTRGRRLIKGTDYTVSYESGRKLPGKYSVQVTFTGRYSGKKTLYFTIKPTVPANLKAVSSTNAITLSWDKVTGATGYRLYFYDADTKAYTQIKTLTGTTYKVEDLSVGTKYSFAVRAYKKEDSEKIWGARTEVLDTATKPKAPTITVSAGTKKATITWNKVKGATGYIIYRSASKTGTYTKIGTVGSGTRQYVSSGLTTGKTYYFKVRAYITNGVKVYGAYSTVKSAIIK